MTTSSVRIFGCPTCGFRVDTSEKTCPRCGYAFSKGTKFECPFCGDLVPTGLDKCPSCHVSYSDFSAKAAPKATEDSMDSLLMEIIRLESTSVKEEAKTFSCPQCDLLLEGTETECPRCGKNLDVEIALQCPVCGALVNAEDAKCRECDTVFDEEAAAAMKHEEAASKLDEIMLIAKPTVIEARRHEVVARPTIKESQVTEKKAGPPPQRAPALPKEPVPAQPAREQAPQEPQATEPPGPPQRPEVSEESLAEIEELLAQAPTPEQAAKPQPAKTTTKRTRKLKAKPKQ